MTDARDAYWMEQTESNVPAGNVWLSGGELSRLATLRFEKRRADWRLGRWTAKCAVASFLEIPVNLHALADIELRAASSVAPEVFLFNQKAEVNISLSHRAGRALAVVSMSRLSLGCDLELVESRDHSFVTDFFTAGEQKQVDAAPVDKQSLLTTLLWSAKESALKALHVGLRRNTNSLEVEPIDNTLWLGSRQSDDVVWSPLSLHSDIGEHFSGWWRSADSMMRTVVFNLRQ